MTEITAGLTSVFAETCERQLRQKGTETLHVNFSIRAFKMEIPRASVGSGLYWKRFAVSLSPYDLKTD